MAHLRFQRESLEAESAEAVRLQRQDLDQTLRSLAELLHDFELAIARRYYDWQTPGGQGQAAFDRAKVEVRYPTEFTMPDLEAELANWASAIALQLGETATKEIRKRAVFVLLPDLAPKTGMGSPPTPTICGSRPCNDCKRVEFKSLGRKRRRRQDGTDRKSHRAAAGAHHARAHAASLGPSQPDRKGVWRRLSRGAADGVDSGGEARAAPRDRLHVLGRARHGLRVLRDRPGRGGVAAGRHPHAGGRSASDPGGGGRNCDYARVAGALRRRNASGVDGCDGPTQCGVVEIG